MSNSPKRTWSSYGDQLKHPNWQRRRLEVLSLADFSCQNCGEKETTLHVHHKRYVKGRQVWEYEDHELEVLCEPCHADRHYDIDLLQRLMLASGDYRGAIGLISGSSFMSGLIDQDLADECAAISGGSFIEGQVASVISETDWVGVGLFVENQLQSTGRQSTKADELVRLLKSFGPEDVGGSKE